MNDIVQYLKEQGPSRRHKLPYDPSHVGGVSKFYVDFENNAHGKNSGHKNTIYYAPEFNTLEEVLETWIEANSQTIEKQNISANLLRNSTDDIMEFKGMAKLNVEV